MSFWIPRCFDSHAHLMSTGMEKNGLPLSTLKSPRELSSLKLESYHFRGIWLTAFGWDHFHFQDKKMPTRFDLDSVYPDFPVYFTRRDGHAVWVNSKALHILGQLPEAVDGGEIVRDAHGEPTGIFIDRAMALFRPHIPPMDLVATEFFLKEGIRVFREAGFTHMRDMGGNEKQWQILRGMDVQGQLPLYVEQNFYFDSMKDFERAIQSARSVSAEGRSPHLRFAGLKFFIDGALGSEGAWLSQPYGGSGQNFGFSLWNESQIEEILRRSWAEEFPVAIHALGDAAVDQVTSVALKLHEKGIKGVLNLEHVEVVRPETVKKIATLKARVHMQPCHWLSDQKFLRSKLGVLYEHVFPWASLEAAGVKICWGSDAPIEKPSVGDNLRALRESSAVGIRGIQADPKLWHSHPDSSWGTDCKTFFSSDQDLQPTQMVFDGQPNP